MVRPHPLAPVDRRAVPVERGKRARGGLAERQCPGLESRETGRTPVRRFNPGSLRHIRGHLRKTLSGMMPERPKGAHWKCDGCACRTTPEFESPSFRQFWKVAGAAYRRCLESSWSHPGRERSNRSPSATFFLRLAQPGSASALGAEGRKFKSFSGDQHVVAHWSCAANVGSALLRRPKSKEAAPAPLAVTTDTWRER